MSCSFSRVALTVILPVDVSTKIEDWLKALTAQKKNIVEKTNICTILILRIIYLRYYFSFTMVDLVLLLLVLSFPGRW
ncbi:hypothetical protein ES703_66987 [subsurface metagenome]